MSSDFYSAGGAAQTSNKDDWGTPRDLFKHIDDVWHFTVDAAASDANALCERYWTKDDDGLAQNWHGERVWCNPPYGRNIGEWVKKAHDAARDGKTIVVLLVPARTDTRWWQDYIYHDADEVLFCRGRLKFTDNGVPRKECAPFPSALVRFGGSLASCQAPRG
jgi:phage N-6-adenine-methyltransferase